MESIPIIDFKDITNAKDISQDNFHTWKELALKIRRVNGETGFFQIINHSVPLEIVENVFGQSKTFFEKERETKLKYEKSSIAGIDSWNGYTGLGAEAFEQGQLYELRETYDWLEGVGLHPDDKEIAPLNDSVKEFNEQCKKLAAQFYKLWAISLDFDDVDFFIKKNKHWTDNNKSVGLSNIRLAYYPPIDTDKVLPPGTVRIAEHTDFASLTFVFQDQTGGLEVRNTDGEWVSAPPVPGAIVCNTGDLLEFWTSGLFLATPHRVLIPEKPEIRKLPRYSVTYFSGPDRTELITPLDLKLSPEEQEQIRKRGKVYSKDPILAGDHVLRRIKTIYNK